MLIMFCILLMVLSYFECNTAVILGTKSYTQFETGNINILISAPHDGTQSPSNIQTRTKDVIGNLVGDANTYVIAKTIQTELSYLFQNNLNISATPFFVSNNLLRNKMDPNREQIDACANTVDDCTIAYTDYHRFIKQNFGDNFMLNNKFAQGLLLDIHGQRHPEGFIEIGYNLDEQDLANLTPAFTRKSTIRKLVSLSNQTFEELIRGNTYSLGGIIQKYFSTVAAPNSSYYNGGVVPSPGHLSPASDTLYYSGGFISYNYASKSNSIYRLNGIQLELPYTFRTQNFVRNAKTLASAIFEYYSKNFLVKQN